MNKNYLSPFFLFVVLLFLVSSCKKPKNPITSENNTGILVDSAMVVSARKEASKIGVQILKKGGNAFDAMIATDLALCVSYPFAGNIGGGGFMVYRTQKGEVGALDYREKAPKAASQNMYLDEKGQVIPKASTLGASAIGVPGTIAGLFAVHEKFGSLAFDQLIEPAIELANKGVIITPKQAKRLNHYRSNFYQANKRKIYLDQEWHPGDTLFFKDLANTLTRIKLGGKDEFYKGQTAQYMVKYVQGLGGILSMDDLANYQAVWRKPIEFTYKDYTITSMTLPSSGGICMGQILKSIEPYNIGQYKHNSTPYIQLITEASRRSFADRAHYLGDIDFVSVPIDSLLDETYLQKRMSDFSWDHATKSSDIKHGDVQIIESDETTHYSIVDAYGNAVSVTTTLNGAYGSKVYVEANGFFLNNEMDDFSIKQGVPNMFGLLGSEANAIAPEKRMLSSMSPTIVSKDNQLTMVLGSPGGSTIITSVLQNILNVVEYNMGMQESVSKPRFHHQWYPDEIKMEPKLFDSLSISQLKHKGYHINEKDNIIIGKVDAILILPDGRLEGGADPRGDDTAIGY